VPSAATIDERAIIHPSAKVAEGVKIGPWTCIGPNVEIGRDTSIGAHVVIQENTKIGEHNTICSFSSLGGDPQHKGYAGEKTFLEIGDHNTIREFCTISRGTQEGGGVTRIGNGNFLMTYVHIAHDCLIGNETIFVNNASLAGHVRIDNFVTIGAFVGVHQFCCVGAYSFVSRAALVFKDILPYLLVVNNPTVVRGLNKVGLKRHGFTRQTLENLQKAYKLIFKSKLLVTDAILELQKMLAVCPEVKLLIDGLSDSERGIVR
jgi:UDP-N-acetylglucosamine acyltransferase